MKREWNGTVPLGPRGSRKKRQPVVPIPNANAAPVEALPAPAPVQPPFLGGSANRDSTAAQRGRVKAAIRRMISRLHKTEMITLGELKSTPNQYCRLFAADWDTVSGARTAGIVYSGVDDMNEGDLDSLLSAYTDH